MSYAGGKGRDGVFQVIVNEMPPHDFYGELFLGAASVMRAKRPALLNAGYDKDMACVSAARAVFCDKRSTSASQESAMAARGGLAHIFDHFRSIDPRYHFRRCDAIGAVRAGAFPGGRLSLAEKRRRGVLLYADPPYLVETRKGRSALYDHEFSDWQHIDLIKALRALRGVMVIISGYPSKLYSDLLHDWRVVAYTNVTRGGTKVTEHLWCNFAKPTELHDYRYIGSDYRDRERIRRTQRNFFGKLRRMKPIERQALMIEALTLTRDL